MRSTLVALSTALLLGSLSLTAAGCREEGPAERAGKAVDEAVRDVTGGGDDVRDRAEETWEDTKDAAEDAWEDTKDAARDAVDDVEDRLDEATDD